MGRWHFFSDLETKNLNVEFVATLERARQIANVPFVITSGYRTPDHNFSVGGVDGSSHCAGLAVDLHCDNSHDAGMIKKGLYSVGITRIGNYFMIDKDGVPQWTHIHCDVDNTKPQNVEWMKIEKYI